MLKDHNAVTPVRLEPAALRSRVKHSTTEPLRSLSFANAISQSTDDKILSEVVINPLPDRDECCRLQMIFAKLDPDQAGQNIGPVWVQAV